MLRKLHGSLQLLTGLTGDKPYNCASPESLGLTDITGLTGPTNLTGSESASCSWALRTLRAWPLHRRELWKPHGSLQLLTGLTSLTRLIRFTARGQQEAKRPGKGTKLRRTPRNTETIEKQPFS